MSQLKYKTFLCLAVCLCILFSSSAQIDSASSFMYPVKSTDGWRYAAGITFMTTPQEITEEFHRRIPSGDYSAIKYYSNKFFIVPRLRFQFIQNEFLLGLGYLIKSKERWGLATELTGSVWGGILKAEANNTQGYGFMCYPSVKVGYALRKDLLLTLKAELLLNLYQKDITGEIAERRDVNSYSGQAVSFFVEQPFFKKTSIVLGFRGMYADFYWQTWALHETFETNIFYPELIINIIL